MVACPSAAGSCGGQFTANTMGCVSEAIGLALTWIQLAHLHLYEARDKFAVLQAVQAVMNLLEKNNQTSEILLHGNLLENAASSCGSLWSGSTNAALTFTSQLANEARY